MPSVLRSLHSAWHSTSQVTQLSIEVIQLQAWTPGHVGYGAGAFSESFDVGSTTMGSEEVGSEGVGSDVWAQLVRFQKAWVLKV